METYFVVLSSQVALITYMAHVGSFVPATSAVIGLTDKILTRVQTRETVSSVPDLNSSVRFMHMTQSSDTNGDNFAPPSLALQRFRARS